MFGDRAKQVLLWIGALGPLYYMALLGVLGTLAIGYDPIRDSMGELGALGSRVQTAANLLGFVGLGVVLFAFAAGLGSSFGPGLIKAGIVIMVALAGASMIVAGLVPCDPGCTDVVGIGTTHVLFSVPSSIMLPAAMVSSTRLLGGDPRFGRTWAVAVFWGGLVSMATAPLLVIEALEPVTGLVQRVGVMLALAWVVAVSARLLWSARRDVEG